MKKIIAMAAMLLAVVVFAYTYRLQTLAWLQLPAFAVTEKDITDTLKADGTPEEDKEVLSMRACTEDEALYRRANRYFIGDKKESVDITYPLFAQEGTALYYLNGDLKLITNDFESYEPYEGMLLSNGTAYDIDGEITTDFPTTVKLEKAKPVLEKLPGWKCDIRGIKKYEDLPENCRNYIEFVEKQIGFPITMISNGPGRDDIIYRNK